jgi:hypothetical protein
MKTKLLFGMLLLGIAVLALGGFAVRRSRRTLRIAFRPVARPAGRPAFV